MVSESRTRSRAGKITIWTNSPAGPITLESSTTESGPGSGGREAIEMEKWSLAESRPLQMHAVTRMAP